MTRDRSMVSISPPGSITGTSTSVPPRARATFAHPDPPMWNSGMATSETEASSTSQASATSISPEQLSLVSITPLGCPVVPEV